MFGTAAILPIYLYLHTKYTEFETFNPTISTTRPRTLMIVSLLAVSIPAAILLSAYSFASEFTRHTIIAGFELSPLLLGVLVAIFSSTESKAPRTSGDRIRHLYIFGGLASGGAHLYTLAITLLSQNENTKFGRVFIPSLSSVTSGSVDNIHDGALLFLQYDWIVVNITCAAWVYLLLDSRQVLLGVRGWATRGVLTLVSTLLLGPGATVSCALYLREEKFLVQYKQAYRR